MSAADWTDSVRALAPSAPEWMRARASAELHIGGFTQAQLDTPVLDVADLGDPQATAAVVFFLVVAAASEAPVARIQCTREAAAALADAVRDRVGPAIERVDDENVMLMRYFDVFLNPPSSISIDDGARLVAALEDTLSA